MGWWPMVTSRWTCSSGSTTDVPRRLLARLGGRVALVVGKGGLGKSTTAGGIALALADDGVATHLLSTDPAHSLGDLFDQPLTEGTTPSRCAEPLMLEELDGTAVARDRLSVLEPALRELIERGTYLDERDAESLLAGVLPGLDEVGAAIRIAALADGGRRLIVDTAPTGHTLRLLDVPRTVESWVRVFRAMAAKSDAVASALLGGAVRMPAEAELDRLETEMAQFDAVIREAAFVVMTGAGDPVVGETGRLLGALESRGLHVAATAAIHRPGARADVILPAMPDLSGCDRLRAWLGALRPEPAPAAVPAPDAGPERPPYSGPALPAGFPDPPWLVLSGKGGVGKTTCSAALAVGLAERGPVTLAGVDPAGSLADVIPDPPAGLTVRQLEPERELDRFRDAYRAEIERAFDATGLGRSAHLDREVADSLWGLAPPGIDEVVAVTRLADDGELEGRLVLDTAPTGHFLRLLAMPDLALDWVHRLMRILLRYGAVGGLDAPAGPLIRLAKRLRALSERLADPSRTAIILVTLEEPLVRAETRRLALRLRERGLEPAALIVNRVTGPPAGAGRDAALQDAAPDPQVPGVTVFTAPEVARPVGARALRELAGRWSAAP